MKKWFKIAGILLAASASMRAQVVPTATGPGGLPLHGNLQVTFRYGQNAQFGGVYGNWQTSSPSAELSYNNAQKRYPFSATYTGGYTFTLTGPSYSSGVFQRLQLVQSFQGKKWSAVLGDDVSYLPQAPTLGFSGVPGTGEPIGSSGTGTSPQQSVLTLNTHVVFNNASLEVEDKSSHALSIKFGGSDNLLRYQNNDGIDTDGEGANAGVAWRLNARNSITADYNYAGFSYPAYSQHFSTDTGTGGYRRLWTRNLSTQISAGPEWISALNVPTETSTGPTPVTSSAPARLTVAANASVSYQLRESTATVFFNRSTNGGGGYVFGGEIDSVTGSYTRSFHKDLTVGLNFGYMRTAELTAASTINSTYAGAEVTRLLGRYISLFGSYSALDQSSDASLPSNTLNGLLHVISFGVGYNPTSLRH
jgi:hypothetical protein